MVSLKINLNVKRRPLEIGVSANANTSQYQITKSFAYSNAQWVHAINLIY